MQSIIDIQYQDGSNEGTIPHKTYNTVYTDPGYTKMVIVQDDEKFPSPRLCLLRRWNDEGYGFHLAEDVESSIGYKIGDIKHNSPAEAGGLRRNDIIIEVNRKNIEYRAFVCLIEILRKAFQKDEMELLVLSEDDANWYRLKNILVNSNFPNIEYCETPRMEMHRKELKPLDSYCQVLNCPNSPKFGTTQIEFHSATGKLFKTTLVIDGDDKEKQTVYKRVEELPVATTEDQAASAAATHFSCFGAEDQTTTTTTTTGAPLRVYYRRDRAGYESSHRPYSTTNQNGDIITELIDSGHGTINYHRGNNTATTLQSPYSTLGGVGSGQPCDPEDLIHDTMGIIFDSKSKAEIGKNTIKLRKLDKNDFIPDFDDDDDDERRRKGESPSSFYPFSRNQIKASSFIGSPPPSVRSPTRRPVISNNQKQIDQTDRNNTITRYISPQIPTNVIYTHDANAQQQQPQPQSKPQQPTKTTSSRADRPWKPTTQHDTSPQKQQAPLSPLSRDNNDPRDLIPGTSASDERKERQRELDELRNKQQRDRQLALLEQQTEASRATASKSPRRPLSMEETTITQTTTEVREKHNLLDQIILETQDPQTGESNRDVLDINYETNNFYVDNDNPIDRTTDDETQKSLDDFEQEFETQQKVMNHLVKAANQPLFNDKLRTYSLAQRPPYFGYGIAFHTEFITPTEPYHKLVYPHIQIDEDSPASETGMRDGQRVVAVNGQYVNRELKTLQDVVIAIEDSYYQRNFTDITVLDPELWSDYMEDPSLASDLVMPASSSVRDDEAPTKDTDNSLLDAIKAATHLSNLGNDDERRQVDPNPRVCHLKRKSNKDTYGFSFKPLKDGDYLLSGVTRDGAADIAGIRDDDYVLEVNGEPVDQMSKGQVIEKINSNPKHVDLRVVNGLNNYLKHKPSQFNNPPTIQDQQQEQPYVKEIEGIIRHNFHITPKERLGVTLKNNAIIQDVEPNSLSDKSGMKKGYRIAEVNGVDVRDKSNLEISKLIKNNQNDLVIGVLPTDEVFQQQQQQQSDPQVDDIKDSLSKAINELAPPTHQQITSQSTSDLTRSPQTDHKLTDTGDKSRVCVLVKRPDYNGYGFKPKRNAKGPHQILEVENNSPAAESGLLPNDYILKVDDRNVVGEGYQSTLAIITNQAANGRFKLEVTDSISPSVKNVNQKRSDTLSTPTTTKPRSGSTDNLHEINRDIKRELESNKSQSMRIDDNRGVSVDTGIDRNRQSPIVSDPNLTQGGGTVLRNKSSKSIGSGIGSQPLPAHNYSSQNEPKFKRCRVEMDETKFSGLGFGLNQKIKPKYTIYRVDENSPAYAANLRPTDVIVEVDGKNIRRLKFEKVTQLLNDAKKRGFVELLVIDRDGYAYHKDKKKRFSNSKLITPQNVEYFPNQGPQLRDDRQQPIIIGSGDENVNLKRIVNDVNEAAVAEVQQQQQQQQQQRPNEHDIDEQQESNDLLNALNSAAAIAALGKDRQQATNDQHIDDGNGPYVAHVITVNRRPDYDGIGLRSIEPKFVTGSDNDADAIEIQKITGVFSGSPASEGGLRKDDVILEINGESAINRDRPTVANMIRNGGDKIQFSIKRNPLSTTTDELQDKAKVITDNAITSAQQKAAAQPSLQTPQSSSSDGIENLRKITEEILTIGRSTGDGTTPSFDLDRVELASRGTDDNISKAVIARDISQPGTPRQTHTEIQMNSSKLQQQQQPTQPQITDETVRVRSPRTPGVNDNIIVKSRSSSKVSSPTSHRSLSMYSGSTPIPRLCVVRTVDEGQLGFVVAGSKSKPGVYKITDITKNSPADYSGLRENDYVIEVSGVSVKGLSYYQVIDHIKSCKNDNQLQMLVVDRKDLDWYKGNNIEISSDVVKKIQYIETLLTDEIKENKSNNNDDINNKSIATESKTGVKLRGREYTITKKVYLCNKTPSEH